MQLCKKISCLSQTVWGAAKKNHLGVAPPPPDAGEGLPNVADWAKYELARIN